MFGHLNFDTIANQTGIRQFVIEKDGISFGKYIYDNSNTWLNACVPDKIYGIKLRSPYYLTQSFEQAKAELVSSSLGVKMGLTMDSEWDDIIKSLASVSANAELNKVISALNEKTSNKLAADSSVEEIVLVIKKSSIFNSGTTYVIYGSGANTSLITGWTGQSSITVSTGGQMGYGTITSANSIDLSSVTSISAFHSYGSQGGCGSYNSYKNCAYHWSQGVSIQIYDKTNTNLVTQCGASAGSCVCDVSTVKQVCYIRVTHQIGHSNGGTSTSTITQVNMVV